MKHMITAFVALSLMSLPVIGAPLVDDAANPANSSATTNSQAQSTLSAPDPRDSVLNRANEKLLIENAELRQQVGKLEVQVQVLQESQSTELFTRGSWMTLLAVLVGFIAAMFLIKRKSEW